MKTMSQEELDDMTKGWTDPEKEAFVQNLVNASPNIVARFMNRIFRR